ncbi:TetR/AcrR family transcriptional regulator C-terminal domain-containing protein [Aurantimonas sp. VKM B-3413]|uniref:TetR/AcrR family transcriptional regulator C-terminal domain-containing protein n=1 Tax=Aurantimonas sp. VKM B-3413 TaxID=2779401 RepID=UPI001E5DE4E1|nr:TetR/AcrR family transcriptional regulator C-terminal domain-containing protein [Aurantimonas sp. VKM B-3413]MCB8840214.1 TetR/AcrR family transcriptional regulator C-terminal domain-containing protein [Aurantimonas sp. VKM B-3413]
MLDQFFGHDRLRFLTRTEQGGARGSAPAANVVPHNLAAPIPTRRTAAVLAASEALADPRGAPACVRSLWRSIGHSEEELAAEFEDADELVVAIAEQKASLMTQALNTGGYPRSEDVARETLVAFGLAAWNEYSTTLPGLVRLLAAEGQRNPTLKQRVFDAGPALVASRLRQFLSQADEAGILRVSDAQAQAQQLMGMLREPLYQALVHLRPPKHTANDHVQESVQSFVHGCGRVKGNVHELD